MKSARLELILAAGLALVVGAALLIGPGEGGGAASGPLPCPGMPRIEDLGGAGREGDVGELAEAVEELRGLSFTTVPRPTYLRGSAFAKRITPLTELPQGEEEHFTGLLESLGAVPVGFELEAELQEASIAGIVGLYDPSTDDLLVRGGGADDGFDATERLTLVHELVHALTDQALGLPPDDPATGEDTLQAQAALVEGDAELVTQAFAAQGLGFFDQLNLGLGSVPVLLGSSELPPYLQGTLAFPYLDGQGFVCHLFRHGGWRAVDEAYRRPPTTTAQILFPERYLQGEEALEPPEIGGLPPPWEPFPPVEIGAADLLHLFAAPGGDPEMAFEDPLGAAAAWGGGLMHVWTRDGDLAAVVSLADRPVSEPLCGSIEEWYERAFPDGTALPLQEGERSALLGGLHAAVVRCTPGGDVLVGLGPDARTARLAMG